MLGKIEIKSNLNLLRASYSPLYAIKHYLKPSIVFKLTINKVENKLIVGLIASI
jgi:hypothetical protein